LVLTTEKINEKRAYEELQRLGLASPGIPLRLHLGCGEKFFPGYVNLDFPPSEHTVMTTAAQAWVDIRQLHFPENSVNEIRNHHLFEHFNRFTAIALLIRWQQWLVPGGRLHIETPDIVGCAHTLASKTSYKVKMGLVRHLAGDHTASWAYHLDHWFPGRFKNTLEQLGFKVLGFHRETWEKEPFLSNVHVFAEKTVNMSLEAMIRAGESILLDSTLDDSEKSTYNTWKRQFRSVLSGQTLPSPVNTLMSAATGDPADSLSALRNQLLNSGSRKPIQEIHDFNQLERNSWVHTQALKISAGSTVLDVGAGTCPYRTFFEHCNYKTQDFQRYDGEKLGGTTNYGHIDYTSDILSIPVPDESIDVVLCTEVLEHVPEPISVIREFVRLLKPGGIMILTAPLGSGLHQLPYHYYGGFTPEWYRYCANRFNLEIIEIKPNGGFFKHLAQECARVAWTFPEHRQFHGTYADTILDLFGEWLPRYLYALDEKHFIEGFTVGFNVLARKRTR
jgi:predicted SAM-dependent methyltransferase